MQDRRKHSGAGSVYAAAAGTIVAFLLSIGLVVDLASREADRHALAAEANMVRLDVRRMTDEAAASIADWAYWDEAVANLSRPDVQRDFVRAEFLEDDISDYGYGWMAVVAPDGVTTVAITGEQMIGKPGSFPLAMQNADLVAAARNRYADVRVGSEGGYIVPVANGGVVPGIEVSAIRMVEGRPSLLTAQVIVPETEEHALAEGQDYVLLAEQPFTPDVMADMARRLGLDSITIAASGSSAGPARVPLTDDVATPSLELTWRPQAPRPAILAALAPVAGGVSLALCAVLGFIVRRHVKALTALASREQELSQMALRDALTGLSNRASFERELSTCIARAQSSKFAVMCIDLDRFKTVNDSHGHAAGDAVLKAVAQRFAARIEGRGIVARIGGDEFIALVTHGTSRDELMWLGDQLVEDASRPVAFEGLVLEVGASVGVAVWPEDGETARDLIASADTVLYESKRAGRGRATLASHEPGMENERKMSA